MHSCPADFKADSGYPGPASWDWDDFFFVGNCSTFFVFQTTAAIDAHSVITDDNLSDLADARVLEFVDAFDIAVTAQPCDRHVPDARTLLPIWIAST
jgi:hypothetical protein